MNTFTIPQRAVLNQASDNMLTHPAKAGKLPAEYLPEVRSLVKLGLITSRKVNIPNYPRTPGGMVWHKRQNTTRVGYVVWLTADGAEALGTLF